MLSHVEELLGFQDNAEIQDTEVTNKSLTFKVDDFVLGEPVSDRVISVNNCIFHNCHINNFGIIHDNVKLTNVTFQDCFFNDHLIVSSYSNLQNVSFISDNKKSMGLWIKPVNYDKCKSTTICNGKDAVIDISNYACNCAEIIGIDVRRIKFNPQKYYVVHYSWRSIPWDNYECPLFGPVRVSLSRLKLFNCESAIYPIPDKETEEYELFEKEMRIIKEHGLN